MLTLTKHHPATFYCIYNALVVFADCFLVTRDTKLRSPITFLIDFVKSLRSQSQIACILFRDFENEYQPLIFEFSNKNQNPFTSVFLTTIEIQRVSTDKIIDGSRRAKAT